MNNTLALLHFDDPNNIAKDEVSKNKWNIIGTGLSINSTNAKFGNALQFNGTESYLQLQGGITLGGEDFTIDWWGVGKGNYNRNRGWWRFFDFNMNKNSEACRVLAGVYEGQSQQMVFIINNTSSSSSSSCNLSALHHYALTYNWNLKQYKTYIDGILKGTFNATLPKSTFTYTLIGMSNHTVDSYLLGTIEEFRVSNCIRWSANFTPPTQQYIYGPYAEFPSTITGTYDRSPNGLTYKYRVRFEQGPYTQTSNVVNYVTEWGTDTKYGNTFQDGCGSYEFKADDATNSVEILSTYAVEAIKKLEDKLNKYIGPFDKPSGRNNLSSNGYVSKGNGTAYFYNIEVLSGSVSPGLTTESATLQFQAKWGTEKNATKLTNIYKNTSIKDETLIDGVKRDAYSTDSEGKVTYTVRPNNYASRESIFKEILDKLENGLKLQLDSYIGNISALDDVRRSITSAGSQYYAKVTRTGTNTEAYATNAKMYLELSYSKGNESYNTIRKDNSGENMYKADLQITGANYLEREKLTNELAQSLLNLWEAYVRTLFDKITKAPESKTDNWPTTTGKNIWVQMDFSLGASSEGEQIINSAFKYSLNNATCDQLYKNGSITINSTNYLTKETEYTNHFNKILAEFKNESSFLNSTPPEEITVNYLALNGITYTCKFKWEYAGTRDWIKSVYRLVTTYGQASDQATTEFRRTTTVEITRENVSYAIRMALFQAEQERELAQLKAYLDTLVANVTIPTPVAREYVATNGQTYAYRVSCTVTPDSDAKSNVTIKSEWGKTTNYGNDFATSTFVLTAVNQTSFDSTVARLMNSHEIKMKGFLDQLIENVAFNGKSGQNLASNGAYYYYKTTVIGLGTTSKTPSEYIKEVGAIE